MASNGAENPSSILEEHVVGNDLVHMLSFTASRRPVNEPIPEEGYVALSLGRSALIAEAFA